MRDDIVIRLREGCSECGLHALYACTHEAADEIERLRADCDRWFKIASGMAGCLDSSIEAGDLLWSYEQAVRGE